MTPMCERCGDHPSTVGFDGTGKLEWLCLLCFDAALHEIGLRIQAVITESIDGYQPSAN